MFLLELAQEIRRLQQWLGAISVEQTLQFIALARRLQNRISWQEVVSFYDLDIPPASLPNSVIAFFSRALGLGPSPVLALWEVFKHSIAAEELFPPSRNCLNMTCSHFLDTGRQHRLYRANRYMATLYTVGRGAFPVAVTSLRCPSCTSTFHLNYFTQRDSHNVTWRIYYDGVPSILKVRAHTFFEDKLCLLFRGLAVHSHSSMSSTARIYNTTLSSPTGRAPLLRGDDIAVAFNLYSLVLHHQEQNARLRIPDLAPTDIDRLSVPMQERNRFMAGTGQEHWPHACDLCRKFFLRDGLEYMLSCAITDGVSIGRPCCAVHDCPNPLPKNHARYCSVHSTLESICSVHGCEERSEEGKKTCSRADHTQLETNYRSVGQSFNLLKSRLRRATAYLHGADEEAPGPSGAPPPKFKAQFARRRTHNEQLIVRPCGIILARGTFYGSESLSGVVAFLQSVFPTAKSLPSVLFYDNNCSLHRYVADRPPLQNYFKDTALVVDIFHFKSKHSANDMYCSLHCNAMAFPQLFDAEQKTWTFNSSACEQTNAWLNRFQPIVREMLPVQYEFFLDEVIKERNRFLVETLKKRGLSPHLMPASVVFD
ncbi:hypothetical protein CALVIDRAFT_489335 [Calocera viscosa TUFC12733]|uniref:CxC5 like cysteine cluster associated with KDZ domain-containing protein n=1 Tax=Calocera viscosa (strain TUFC12733) TaxID=1330018 RepID=A0A167H601_CALVF|nr:hypothetical protein CALVIDRAFT_489335 [Calocera viscosa TUFC12733]